VDGDLDSVKLKIPNFQGKNDLEAYLEWEKKVDWIFFYYHSYSEQNRGRNYEEKKIGEAGCIQREGELKIFNQIRISTQIFSR
jgi:hypothetical protein